MAKSNVSGYAHQTLPDKETKLRAIRCQNEDFKKKNEIQKEALAVRCETGQNL